jgi:hypothetical protein
VHGWLYVNDADAGQIEKFTLTGTPLTNWGSSGSGPGQFADGGRQLAVGPDGDVWDADYGNFRVQRFTPNGTLKGIYPDPAAVAPVGAFSSREAWPSTTTRARCTWRTPGRSGSRSSRPTARSRRLRPAELDRAVRLRLPARHRSTRT